MLAAALERTRACKKKKGGVPVINFNILCTQSTHALDIHRYLLHVQNYTYLVVYRDKGLGSGGVGIKFGEGIGSPRAP